MLQVHWLGSNLAELPRYEVHGNALVAVQEPGFVVRGFLWCGGKNEEQLDARFKEVHKLESCKWPDKETCAIVSHGDPPGQHVDSGRHWRPWAALVDMHWG